MTTFYRRKKSQGQSEPSPEYHGNKKRPRRPASEAFFFYAIGPKVPETRSEAYTLARWQFPTVLVLTTLKGDKDSNYFNENF